MGRHVLAQTVILHAQSQDTHARISGRITCGMYYLPADLVCPCGRPDGQIKIKTHRCIILFKRNALILKKLMTCDTHVDQQSELFTDPACCFFGDRLRRASRTVDADIHFFILRGFALFSNYNGHI